MHGTWKTTGGGGGDVGGVLVFAVAIGVAVAVAEALVGALESLFGALFMAGTCIYLLAAVALLVRAIRRRWRHDPGEAHPARRSWMPPLTVIYRDPPPVERQPEPRALPVQVPQIVNHYHGTVNVYGTPDAVRVVRGQVED